MAQRYATREEIIGPSVGVGGGVAPEYNALTDEQLAVWSDIAASMIGLGRWAERASQGHALLTAHLIASLGGADGSGGGIDPGLLASESDGPASRSYFHAQPSDAELATTRWGKAYTLLRRVVQGSGVFVTPHRRLMRR